MSKLGRLNKELRGTYKTKKMLRTTMVDPTEEELKCYWNSRNKTAIQILKVESLKERIVENLSWIFAAHNKHVEDQKKLVQQYRTIDKTFHDYRKRVLEEIEECKL